MSRTCQTSYLMSCYTINWLWGSPSVILKDTRRCLSINPNLQRKEQWNRASELFMRQILHRDLIVIRHRSKIYDENCTKCLHNVAYFNTLLFIRAFHWIKVWKLSHQCISSHLKPAWKSHRSILGCLSIPKTYCSCVLSVNGREELTQWTFLKPNSSF